MFKILGIQVAVAMALLMSMSAPVFADDDNCGQSKGECDRDKGSDVSGPDLSGFQSESEQPEPPEARLR
jgi:hypothetical protein